MKIIKKIGTFLFLIIFLIIVCLAYAFFIEPYRITTNYYTLNQENGSQPLRIVQITDLHITRRYNISQLEKIVTKIQDQNPDIIVFTGDLYDDYASYNVDDSVISALRKLEAPYGKYAVWGNHDYGGGAQLAYQRIMSESDFTLLTNESATINIHGEQVRISGLDDALFGQPNDDFLASNATYAYHILLSHEPDIVDFINLDNVQLVLSGHSHGGQVNIPGLARQTTVLAENYVQGFYDINGNNTKLYVSTGLGTTTVPIRFLVPPEIAIFDIYI